jgi:hypothetical protein
MANGALNITEMRFTFRKLTEKRICFYAQQTFLIEVKASIINYKLNSLFIGASNLLRKIRETKIRKSSLINIACKRQHSIQN